jgi:hypothetical protein
MLYFAVVVYSRLGNDERGVSGPYSPSLDHDLRHSVVLERYLTHGVRVPMLQVSILVDRFHETNRIEQMERTTDLILKRHTDLGFTRDRHIKYASRLQPTCGAPSRRPHPEELGALLTMRRSRACARALKGAREGALLRTRLIDAAICNP